MSLSLKKTDAARLLFVPQQNQLLAALSAEAQARLFPQLVLVELKAGQVLHEPSKTMRHAYFPLDCILALECLLVNGHAAEVSVVGNEGLIGVSLCLGSLTAARQVVALGPGFAYRIAARQLVQEFNRHGELHTLVLRYTNCLMMQIAQTAVCSRYHSIGQRLCRLLLLSMDRVRDNGLVMTHELMAHMLGVRREGVTAAASHLHELGIIDYKRGHIAVLDRPRLQAHSCECYSVVRKATAVCCP